MRRELRERLLFFALVPAVLIAVLVLGITSLRTTRQIERGRRQTVIDATLALADERVDRLDKFIVAQDNVVVEHVDPSRLEDVGARWLPTAARETPSVRAVLVLDMSHPEHEVLAFASRRPGPEDELLRRRLVTRFLPQLDTQGRVEELRHLHDVAEGQSSLLSYWQRTGQGGGRVLVVAWHDVGRLVHDAMPRLYRDPDRGNARMNVVDEQGRLVFGPPIQGGEFVVGRNFPTTLYNWRVQTALTSAEELSAKVDRQRRLELAMVAVAVAVALIGLLIVVVAAVRARRLSALKSDFVANVSHELKTPLSLIRMFGELSLQGRVPTEEKRKQYLQIIVTESERLTALIDNVLDFAKAERGRAGYEFVEQSLADVVVHALEVSRYRADREGVAVTLSVAPELPPVCVDARALELALVNLLDNAIKYGRDGGRVEVSVQRSRKGVSVRVADWGPGLSPEEQPRIFERFVRGRVAGERKVRGSGIGLSLVKQIAHAHGGSVEVQSPKPEDGSGAAFVLDLPTGRTRSLLS